MVGFLKAAGVGLFFFALTATISGVIVGALFGEVAGLVAALALGGLSGLKQFLARWIMHDQDIKAKALQRRRAAYFSHDARLPNGDGRLLPFLETMPVLAGRFRFTPTSVMFMSHEGVEVELPLTPDVHLADFDECVTLEFGPAAGHWILQILDPDRSKWTEYLLARGLRERDVEAPEA